MGGHGRCLEHLVFALKKNIEDSNEIDFERVFATVVQSISNRYSRYIDFFGTFFARCPSLYILF